MIDFIYDGLRIRSKRIEKKVTEAVDTVFKMCGVNEYAVAILLTGDKKMRYINRRQRNIDNTTDVLSFPSTDSFKGDEDGFFGDIVISLPRARRQARAYKQSFLREMIFLAVHSSLHLNGYDHDFEDNEIKMRSAQREAIARMGE